MRSRSNITTLERFSGDGADLIHIAASNGNERWLGLSHDAQPGKRHLLTVGGRTFEWDGFYGLFGKAE